MLLLTIYSAIPTAFPTQPLIPPTGAVFNDCSIPPPGMAVTIATICALTHYDNCHTQS